MCDTKSADSFLFQTLLPPPLQQCLLICRISSSVGSLVNRTLLFQHLTVCITCTNFKVLQRKAVQHLSSLLRSPVLYSR